MTFETVEYNINPREATISVNLPDYTYSGSAYNYKYYAEIVDVSKGNVDGLVDLADIRINELKFLQNGEEVKAVVEAGEYEVEIVNVYHNPNYSLTFETSTFTIVKRDVDLSVINYMESTVP